MENDNELNDMAPKLASLKKKDTYRTPEGYFEELPGRVMDRIEQDNDPRVIELWSYGRTLLAAASVAAVIAISFGIYESSAPQEEAGLTAYEDVTYDAQEVLFKENAFYEVDESTDYIIEADAEEVIGYMEEVIFDDIDQEDILLAMEDINWDQEPTLEISDDDELIEYLLLEGIDLDMIMAEL